MSATVETPTTGRLGRLVRTGLLAGVASMAAIAIAALARAADVPLEIDDKTIALAAFALQTMIATAAGVMLAAVIRRRRPFLAITLAATALSLIPAPDRARRHRHVGRARRDTSRCRSDRDPRPEPATAGSIARQVRLAAMNSALS